MKYYKIDEKTLIDLVSAHMLLEHIDKTVDLENYETGINEEFIKECISMHLEPDEEDYETLAEKYIHDWYEEIF